MSNIGFHYSMYVYISLGFGVLSAIYNTTYNSWFPDLIPKGLEQKGYAVSSSLYPTITIVMSPISAFLYKVLPMYQIFWIVSALMFLSVLFECSIKEEKSCIDKKKRYFTSYREEIVSGFRYVRKEKGIQNIYLYMGVTNGISNGNYVMIQAFFQSNPSLGALFYSFLLSAETFGRMFGGIFIYHKEISPVCRYPLTKKIYYIYELFETVLLFLPFPLTLVNRFIIGALGMTSATIRSSCVASYIKPQMRAKVNAVFSAYFAVAGMSLQFFVGVIGDFVGFRPTVVLMSTLCMLFIYIFIQRPMAVIRKVYEAVRIDTEPEVL